MSSVVYKTRPPKSVECESEEEYANYRATVGKETPDLRLEADIKSEVSLLDFPFPVFFTRILFCPGERTGLLEHDQYFRNFF